MLPDGSLYIVDSIILVFDGAGQILGEMNVGPILDVHDIISDSIEEIEGILPDFSKCLPSVELICITQ